MARDVQARALMEAFASRFTNLEIADVWGDGLEVDLKLDDSVNLVLLANGLREELGDIAFELRLDSSDLSTLRITCYPELESDDQVGDDFAESQTPTKIGGGTVLVSSEEPTALLAFPNGDDAGVPIETADLASDTIAMLRRDLRLEVLASDGVLTGISLEVLGRLWKAAAASIALSDEDRTPESDLDSTMLVNVGALASYKQMDDIPTSVLVHSGGEEIDFHKLTAETLSLADQEDRTHDITYKHDDLEVLTLIERAEPAIECEFRDLLTDGASDLSALENDYGSFPPVVTLAVNDGSKLPENAGKLPRVVDTQYFKASGRADTFDRVGKLQQIEPVAARARPRRRTIPPSTNGRLRWGFSTSLTFGALLAFVVMTIFST